MIDARSRTLNRPFVQDCCYWGADGAQIGSFYRMAGRLSRAKERAVRKSRGDVVEFRVFVYLVAFGRTEDLVD